MATRFSITLAALTIASAVYAQPATAPAPTAAPDAPTERRDGPPPLREGGPMRERGFGGGFGRERGEVPSDEEWKTISEFFQAEFPNRWSALEETRGLWSRRNPEGAEAMFNEGKRRLAGRYRMLERLRSENQAVYESAMKHAKAEDEVWGAWREFNRARSEETRTALRTKVTALVEDTFRERQERIESLAATLKREQEQLARDRLNPDNIVSEHMDQLEGNAPPREDGYPGGRGPRGILGGPRGPGGGPGGGGPGGGGPGGGGPGGGGSGGGGSGEGRGFPGGGEDGPRR